MRDWTPLRDSLKALEPLVEEAIEHDWYEKLTLKSFKIYIDNHPKLAENYRGRKFRHVLWDVAGCEASLGHCQQFTSEEQMPILYASSYGIEAPKRIPYQKGEQAPALPPPTASELEGLTTSDPKLLGIWVYLLSYMSEEHKRQVKEQAPQEGVSAGYRHTPPPKVETKTQSSKKAYCFSRKGGSAFSFDIN